MDEVGIPYESVRGEAAFYGPKIDFQVSNVIGREETASTNQLDLVMAERFGLTYRDQESVERAPMIIHRAPLGTHERFCAFLIEHYGGVFPSWLAPVQVRIIPVASAFFDYAEKLEKELKSRFIRSQVDLSTDSFGKDPQRCGLKGPELAHPRRAGNFGGLRDLAALRNQGTDQARFRYLFDAVRGRNPQPQRLAHHSQLNLSNTSGSIPIVF